MVKRQTPRILAASALAALVVGLSACGGTPQTLVPYTPAHGVNVDAPRLGAPADANDVPLKVRNLVIVAEPDSDSGFLSAGLQAPIDRDDRLVSVEGRTFDAENQPAEPIEAVEANVELPAGRLVLLTDGEPVEVSSPGLQPGLVAELTLTFEGSEAQTLLVPIMDATHPDYEGVAPGGEPAEGTTAAPAGPATPAEATPVPNDQTVSEDEPAADQPPAGEQPNEEPAPDEAG